MKNRKQIEQIRDKSLYIIKHRENRKAIAKNSEKSITIANNIDKSQIVKMFEK